MSATSFDRTKRKRAIIACEYCRCKKVACDDSGDRCSRCTNEGLACIRKRRRNEDTLKQLQAQLETNEPTKQPEADTQPLEPSLQYFEVKENQPGTKEEQLKAGVTQHEFTLQQLDWPQVKEQSEPRVRQLEVEVQYLRGQITTLHSSMNLILDYLMKRTASFPTIDYQKPSSMETGSQDLHFPVQYYSKSVVPFT